MCVIIYLKIYFGYKFIKESKKTINIFYLFRCFIKKYIKDTFQAAGEIQRPAS